jgi:2-polyprenyl-6-methoxyphenol hydroxylase-like FAD-dependent oxidoreductase
VTALRIAIVGAGTAGSAAALHLARAGHACTLFERVAAPGPVGAGITLQPTGQQALARLGLLAAIEARATRVDGLLCRRPSGKPVVDLRYADVDPRLYGLGLHRGVLFETLLAAVRAQPGVTLHTGVEIVAAPRQGAQRVLRDAAGGSHGPFELVVVADGSVSELHGEAGQRVRARPYPWGAVWFVAEDRGNTLTDDRRVLQIVDGARRMFGLLPTGLAPRGDRPVVSVFWSIRADRVAALRARGLAAWQAEALALAPHAGPIVEQVTDIEQLRFTQYRDVAMRAWHADGMLFIGDAAHATSPQLGQGANLALWDAQALADVVAEVSARGLGAAAIGPAYTAARRRHLNYYQFATRALTPFFQSDSRVAGWLRDLVFPTSRWIGPLRRRMVRTMCGLDRGIVRRPIPLAEVARARLPDHDRGGR